MCLYQLSLSGTLFISYRVDGGERLYDGAALMHAGISFPLISGEYQSIQLHLTAEPK